jgi:cell division protein FtsQ
MRSLSAASNMPKGRARASAGRRSASVRVPGGYPAGSRKKARTAPIPLFFGAIKRALDPRRPVFRTIALLAAVAAVIYAFAAGYVHRGTARLNQSLSNIAADAGFGISAIRISGTRYAPPGEIVGALGFKPGDSIFAVDPQQARENLRRLHWITEAGVSRRYPDLVLVHIVERTPFGLWQSPRGFYAVDKDGRPIARIDPARIPHLFLFIGDAPDGASKLLGAVRRQHAVAARVKAAQRVDSRRWNLILDNGVVVKLPEDNWQREIPALEHLIVDRGVLERDISEIDLRDHNDYIFVLRHAAPTRNSRGEPT